MSVDRSKISVGYGLTNSLQQLSPQPIIALRNPTTSDIAELGTLWVNKNTNAYYVATSTTAGATTWQAQATGAGNFAAVHVTGPVGNTFTVDADSTLTGTLDVGGNTTITGDLAVVGDATVTGDFDITAAAAVTISSTVNASPAIYLHANGGVNESIDIHSDQGTALDSIYVLSDVGGIKLEAAANVAVNAVEILSDFGGISMAAAKHSIFSVTGAGEDLELWCIGGSFYAHSDEAVANAIRLHATDAAGGVSIIGAGGITMATTNTAAALTTGTGAINLGTDAVAKTITLGNNTGATSVVVNAGTAGAGSINVGTAAHEIPITIGNVTGATGVTVNTGTSGFAVNTTGAGDVVVTSADTVLIDAAGVLELNSSAGIIGIGNDAVAQNINIGTGAAARTVTVGNGSAASSVIVNTGTGNIDLGVNATDHTSRLGSVTGVSATTIQAGTGAMTLTAGGILDANVTGAVTIDGTSLSLDGTLASNLTVTGAGQDVTVSSVGGSVVVNGSEAIATAVHLDASDAAGGVTIETGTAGMLVTAPFIELNGIKIYTGAGVPANGLAISCGDMYINTTAATAATRLYIATAANTWTYIPAFA